MLEQMAPEVDREKKDAADAKDFLEMLEKTYAEAGGKLQAGPLASSSAPSATWRAPGSSAQMAEQQAEAARRRPG